jgi:hypothetical protein
MRQETAMLDKQEAMKRTFKKLRFEQIAKTFPNTMTLLSGQAFFFQTHQTVREKKQQTLRQVQGRTYTPSRNSWHKARELSRTVTFENILTRAIARAIVGVWISAIDVECWHVKMHCARMHICMPARDIILLYYSYTCACTCSWVRLIFSREVNILIIWPGPDIYYHYLIHIIIMHYAYNNDIFII